MEVYMDGSADVEIHGDRGFLRTLSGQRAQWRRFERFGPMPTNPGDFRFSGVDGRIAGKAAGSRPCLGRRLNACDTPNRNDTIMGSFAERVIQQESKREQE
jgi:hypothetical protein